MHIDSKTYTVEQRMCTSCGFNKHGCTWCLLSWFMVGVVRYSLNKKVWSWLHNDYVKLRIYSVVFQYFLGMFTAQYTCACHFIPATVSKT